DAGPGRVLRRRTPRPDRSERLAGVLADAARARRGLHALRPGLPRCTRGTDQRHHHLPRRRSADPALLPARRPVHPSSGPALSPQMRERLTCAATSAASLDDTAARVDRRPPRKQGDQLLATFGDATIAA